MVGHERPPAPFGAQSGACVIEVPSSRDLVRLGKTFDQAFVVTVDVEEEFDWNGPFRRDGYGLATIPAILDFQALCDAHGVRPIYLVDYPVISDPRGAEIFGTLAREDRADIGIQLHPWVNPPFEEPLSAANSFAGNLPADLERAKFMALRDAIEAATGIAPIVYRAGRYGIGPHTAAMLAEAGIEFDTSVRAKFDYSHEGGPDFSRHPLRPYWIDREAGLMELPLTTIFWGLLRKQGDMLYPLVDRWPSVSAVAARGALLERIALTPEGISVEEAVRGIDIALDDGLPLLTFSFHSPSLCAGHTPYVHSQNDVVAFYDWWSRIFAYLAQRGVRAETLSGLRTASDGDRRR